MLRAIFQKRQIRKLFAKYLSNDIIDQAISGAIETNHTKESMISYCIIIIKNVDLEVLQKTSSAIIDMALNNRINIDSICSNLIIMSCGTIHNLDKNLESMKQFGSECISAFSDKVKLLVCTTKAFAGNLGTKNRMAYTFITNTFNDNLKIVIDMPYGKVKYVEELN